jgi:c-di-GMP-binding flagellar brake protein YcgR
MTQKSQEAAESRQERRRFVRASIYAVTRYFCPLRDREVGVQTRISDISEGGALLVTFMEGVPINAPVKMNFVMPGSGETLLSVEGVIRHTGPLEKDLFRSGVEFLKTKKKDLQAIRDYVASQRKK